MLARRGLPALVARRRLRGLEADGDAVYAGEGGPVGQVQRQHDGPRALDVLRVSRQPRRCRLHIRAAMFTHTAFVAHDETSYNGSV